MESLKECIKETFQEILEKKSKHFVNEPGETVKSKLCIPNFLKEMLEGFCRNPLRKSRQISWGFCKAIYEQMLNP